MKQFLFPLFFLLFSLTGFSQIININNTADAESNDDLQTLIENVLITGTCAQIDNFSEIFNF